MAVRRALAVSSGGSLLFLPALRGLDAGPGDGPLDRESARRVITEEMLSARDWYKTFAALAGASDKVPADRPMDGTDASEFLLGESGSAGRRACCSSGRTAR